ncbi:MAG: phosphate ABC transporter permease PstA [Alphaproteobacteria bacterium]|jgi:phosphate transport system permease protein|nr:phosphate ABC transporter permease PstA [Alphaproteobacteria bacterium]
MTDVAQRSAGLAAGGQFADRLRRRHRAERRFRLYGIAALALALVFLGGLFYSILSKAYTALGQTEIALEIHFDATVIDPGGGREPEALARADYAALVKRSLGHLFPEVEGRRDKRALRKLVSPGAAFELQTMVRAAPELIGQKRTVWLPAADDVDMHRKGLVEGGGRISTKQTAWIEELEHRQLLELRFNGRFFTAGDSREPELAGIFGAFVGSALTLAICLVLAFPLGVMTAVYLEEFAPRNRWTDLIEVNINNLAAVPSIVFGLLGLAVLLGTMGLPRSAPLVGGIVLALMTLPTVIIAGRAALEAVPPSIREAAFGVGASPMQVVWHHVLPLAMPGVLTGTIIGMARALGETAPLLMIGMVAFIVDVPTGPTDPATALPVQIYLWADAPERAFAERTAAAILVLLAFLIVMNLGAVLLRRRFEQRW